MDELQGGRQELCFQKSDDSYLIVRITNYAIRVVRGHSVNGTGPSVMVVYDGWMIDRP